MIPRPTSAAVASVSPWFKQAVLVMAAALAFLPAACNAPNPAQPTSPANAQAVTRPATAQPAVRTLTTTPLPSATSSPTPSPTPSPTATPDPFAPFSIEGLRSRAYGSGPIEVVETLATTQAFTRYAVAYSSDGLRITAMLNVPNGPANQRYPVIILNHGYVDPDLFPTGSYIRAEADYLARSGYLTLSPDYRGHAGSDGDAEASGSGVRGMNTFRAGYAVDVLSLLRAIPSLPQADAERVGMWGHSMGGGITLKVLVVDRGATVRAAVLYGAMSGDEAANLRHIDQMWQPGLYERVTAIYGTPEERPGDYARISALTYLADIAAPIAIHHGALDDQVPVEWSRDLNRRLLAAGQPVEYFEYEDAGHSFAEGTWITFMQRVTAFFDEYVKGKPRMTRIARSQ